MKLELSLSVCIIHPSVIKISIPYYTGWFMRYGHHCRCNRKSFWIHGSYSQWVWCYGWFLIFVNAFLWTVCTSDKVYNMLHHFKQALFLTMYGIWCKQISGSSLWDPHASSTGSQLLLHQAMCTIHNYEKRYTVNIQNPSLSTVWCKLKAILWL